MKTKDVNYMNFNVSRFVNDPDYMIMKPIERGIYIPLTYILFLNKGSIEMNRNLYRILNFDTEDHFHEVWDKTKYKFIIKDNKIYSAFVTEELRRIYKIIKTSSLYGKKGAKKRWAGHSPSNSPPITTPDSIPNSNPIAKGSNETERNRKGSNEKERDVTKKQVKDDMAGASQENQGQMTEKENVSIPASNLISCSSTNSLRNPSDDRDIQIKAIAFLDTLNKTIPPRTRSDRTCYQKVVDWLVTGCRDNKFTADMFEHVLQFAKESQHGDRPQALFMSLITKQLGYNPRKEYK